jgi:predicted secreted protein
LPAAAHAETLLRLSETAHVQVAPDEIVAALRYEASAPTPAEAQARVNTAIGKALDDAKQVAGITSSTGSYQVWQKNQSTGPWSAAQTITLKGSDGAEMLKLVGLLQGQGLGLQQLAWQVSPARAREAQAEATKMALGTLRTRAEEAAAVLGLRFTQFREVRLDGTRPVPIPRMMAMAAASAPMPHAEGQEQEIEATVEADAVLVPIQP